MRLQNAFFAGHKIVGVVLHHGSTLCILDTRCHQLHYTDHCGYLPVALRSEAVAFFHQSLDRQTRKLLQTTKHAECVTTA